MTLPRRDFLAACTTLAALGTTAALPLAARAQGFPDKPIRLVVPYAPGGTTDVMARVLQEPVQKTLGQTLLVDNRPGAAGSIAAKDVARAAPDGYTLLFVNNGNLAVVPFIMKDAGYDGVKDFTPIAQVSHAPMVVIVPAALPANDLREFIAYAKTHPVSYATAGIGSFGHLVSELFAKQAGLELNGVPYKGQAPTTNAVLSGEVQLLITSPSGTMSQYIAEKRLKLLGVTSQQQSPLAPGTPTVASVLPGFEAESWFAIVGPAGMSKDVVEKLNKVFSAAVTQPQVEKSFNDFGLLPRTSTPEALATKTAEEVERWSAVIRENHITTG